MLKRTRNELHRLQGVFGRAGALGIGVCLLLLFVGCGVFDPPEKFLSVKEGMTQNEIEKAVGKPMASYSREDAPRESRYEGYWYPLEQVRNAKYEGLLIYDGGSHLLYVFFDSENVATCVEIGGS